MGLWIPGGRHQWVDFGVERHTLVTGKKIQVFHQIAMTYLQVYTTRVHFFREKA
jgi:hypothetical protein